MSEARRLHPMSPVFSVLRQARALLLPGLIVLFVGGDSWQLWIMILFVPSAVFEIGRYFTFRYRLTDDHIVTTLAFISRNERSVHYERIQNIESVQSVFHRAFGVTEVRVETGAGGKPEVLLRVVPTGEVERIRARVFAAKDDSEPERGVSDAAEPISTKADERREVLLRLGGLDFVRLGLITMRGMVLLAVLLGLAWEFDLFDRLGPVREWLFDRAVGSTDAAIGLTVGAVLMAAIGGLVGTSVLWAWLRFGGFELSRSGEDFRIRSGLLTRVGATVPRHRVQLVKLTESFQHRRIGRVAIGVETAGGVDPESGAESSFGRQWFAPLVRPEDVPALAARIRPSLTLAAEQWPGLSPRAKGRRFRKSIATGVAVGALVGLVAGLALAWWGVAIGAALAAVIVAADRRDASMARREMSDDWIACRTGILTRRTLSAFLDRVQVVDITESPFDRRAGMANLKIDTAGGVPMGQRVEHPMLDRGEAEHRAMVVARAAERGGFVW